MANYLYSDAPILKRVMVGIDHFPQHDSHLVEFLLIFLILCAAKYVQDSGADDLKLFLACPILL